MNEKRSYYVNLIEACDGKMNEVLNFNFCGHHDLAKMMKQTCEAGWFEKEKHAKEFVLAMRFMHHVIKKNPDIELFREFGPQFETFKSTVKQKMGCECECNDECNDECDDNGKCECDDDDKCNE